MKNRTFFFVVIFLFYACETDISNTYRMSNTKYGIDELELNKNEFKHQIRSKETNEVLYEKSGQYKIEGSRIILYDFFLNFPEINLSEVENHNFLEMDAVELPFSENNGKIRIKVNPDLSIFYDVESDI